MCNRDPDRYITEIKASDSEIVQPINLKLVRTLSVTARLVYNAAAVSGARINAYYSPNGFNYDTVAYTYFDIDLSAGSEVQETALFDVPEIGWLKLSAQNRDNAVSVTACSIWITKVEWSGGSL